MVCPVQYEFYTNLKILFENRETSSAEVIRGSYVKNFFGSSAFAGVDEKCEEGNPATALRSILDDKVEKCQQAA